MAVIKHADQRVGLFIDTQNLYHSAKNLYGAKVNFEEVLMQAVAGRILVRAMAYVIRTESGEERGFFDALEHIGIETKVKDLQIFAGGSKKGDWDVGMAVDAIKLAPKLDTVILATADGDFVPLVEYLQNVGCQVEVIAFGRSTSMRLKEHADDFIDMDLDPKAFLIPSRTGNGSLKPPLRRAPIRRAPLHNDTAGTVSSGNGAGRSTSETENHASVAGSAPTHTNTPQRTSARTPRKAPASPAKRPPQPKGLLGDIKDTKR